VPAAATVINKPFMLSPSSRSCKNYVNTTCNDT
jgi:hypothetical protein